MSVSPSSAAAPPTLADLLARCRQHEPAAQLALYERFAVPMLAVATRYAPSRPDAEDALQDAFIKIFANLPDQREPGAFAGWVRRIVVSTAIDAWHQRRRRRIEFALDDALDVPTPDASAIEQLTVAEIKTLIDRLPAGCRLVMLLFTIEGYAHAEIAELLGIAEAASRMQLARARQRLTVLIEQANRERRPAPTPTPAPRPDAARLPFHPPLTPLFLP